MQDACITIGYFFAPKNITFEEQIQLCFDRLSAKSDEAVEIVKLTVFVPSTGNSDYSEKLRLLKEAGSKYPRIKSPITLVSQPLADEQGLAVEVWTLITPGYTIDSSQNKFRGGESLQVNTEGFSALFVSCQCNGAKGFAENVSGAFSTLDNILGDRGFDFSDVVRQWNYIENITLKDDLLGTKQNYQAFNDTRSVYYQKNLWTDGYPAATGIGMNTGGLAIEAIAVKANQGVTVKSIASPVQTEAFEYSSNVLVGERVKEVIQTTTPKFVRAKYLDLIFGKTIFVSGTASIIGEKTKYTGNAGMQTRLAIENMRCLVTTENLRNTGISDACYLKLLNYRVYIKNYEDFPIIQQICREEFGDFPALFVRADVCRNDLLVEIEANYSISYSG